VQQIVAAARKFNASRDITGVLLLGDGYFLQCLEGDRAAVSDLYRHIARDQRHTGVQLLEFDTIPGRGVPGWAIGYISGTRAIRSAVALFSPASKFDPYQMAAANALALARYLGTVKAPR
jgi:hypothetical protein